MKLEVERKYEVWQETDYWSSEIALVKSYDTLEEAKAKAKELDKGVFNVSIYIRDYPIKNNKDNYIIGSDYKE